MRKATDIFGAPSLVVFSELLCGKQPSLAPAVRQVPANPVRRELVDMDSYIKPENPFPPIAEALDEPPVVCKAPRTPYYDSSEVDQLNIRARREAVITAAANGLLEGCGVTLAGFTLYPEMLRDVPPAEAAFAKDRAKEAKSCVWFSVVDR